MQLHFFHYVNDIFLNSHYTHFFFLIGHFPVIIWQNVSNYILLLLTIILK